jgi:hypothetical protein
MDVSKKSKQFIIWNGGVANKIAFIKIILGFKIERSKIIVTTSIL